MHRITSSRKSESTNVSAFFQRILVSVCQNCGTFYHLQEKSKKTNPYKKSGWKKIAHPVFEDLLAPKQMFTDSQSDPIGRG
jgi:hypothetical protein